MLLKKITKWLKSFTTLEVYILILLFQIFISLLAVMHYCYRELGLYVDYYETIPSSYLVISLLLLSGSIGGLGLYWFKEMNSIAEQEKTYELQDIKLRQMQEANDLLSSQKHDFLNSLQVIWGLALINDRDKAVSYIQKLTNDLKTDKIEISEINKEEHPYLYTLLINKLHKCKESNIDMELNLYDLQRLSAINPIDLVNIFGNLIDNAIYEVKKLPVEYRKICIDIYEEYEDINIEIFNKGPKIEQHIMDKMFQRGFTTKGEEGTGIGLYNVKSIVEKYGGSIEVVSDEEYGTNFIIRFKNVNLMYTESN